MEVASRRASLSFNIGRTNETSFLRQSAGSCCIDRGLRRCASGVCTNQDGKSRRAALAIGHDGDQRDGAEGRRLDGVRGDQRAGRRNGLQDRAGGRRPRLELAAVRRESATAADAGKGRRGIRLLDFGIAQVGAAGLRGAQRSSVLPRAVRGRGNLAQRLLYRSGAQTAGDPGGRVPDVGRRRRREALVPAGNRLRLPAHDEQDPARLTQVEGRRRKRHRGGLYALRPQRLPDHRGERQEVLCRRQDGGGFHHQRRLERSLLQGAGQPGPEGDRRAGRRLLGRRGGAARRRHQAAGRPPRGLELLHVDQESCERGVHQEVGRLCESKGAARAQGQAADQRSDGGDLYRRAYVEAGGREGEELRRRESDSGHGRPDVHRPLRHPLEDGREEPSPLPGGIHRRSEGRRPVQRGVEDQGSGEGPAVEPVYPRQRQEGGRTRPDGSQAVRAGKRARALCGVLALFISTASSALDPAAVEKLAFGESDERIQAIGALVAEGDPRAAEVLAALADGELQTAGKRVLIVRAGEALDAATGEKVAPLPAEREDVVANNRLRGAIGRALAALKLVSRERGERLAAARALAGGADASMLPLVKRTLEAETDADGRSRLSAIRTLGSSGNPSSKTLLLEAAADADAEIRAEAQKSLLAVDARLRRGEWLGLAFAGVSLGSILLLAALGLAITYGLMGVINMAHGELIMVGAY